MGGKLLQSDNHNRLATISSTYGETDTLGYDGGSGNLSSKDGQTYSYPTSGRVHGVTSAGTKGTFTYDANGNMATRTISGTPYNLTYEQAKSMVGYNGGTLTSSFVYDGDGVRVKGTVNGVTTIYVGEHYEVSGTTVKKYYSSGGTRVAMNISGSSIPEENGL